MTIASCVSGVLKNLGKNTSIAIIYSASNLQVEDITYMVSDLNGSTCLASSIDNYELPSKSSPGSFRFSLSNTCEKAISETDLAHNFKMPKQLYCE